MKEKNNTNYKEIYGDFDCPGCGKSTDNGDNIYDAGNGYCQECAPNY